MQQRTTKVNASEETIQIGPIRTKMVEAFRRHGMTLAVPPPVK
jgi:hypothetical protein